MLFLIYPLEYVPLVSMIVPAITSRMCTDALFQLKRYECRALVKFYVCINSYRLWGCTLSSNSIRNGLSLRGTVLCGFSSVQLTPILFYFACLFSMNLSFQCCHSSMPTMPISCQISLSRTEENVQLVLNIPRQSWACLFAQVRCRGQVV